MTRATGGMWGKRRLEGDDTMDDDDGYMTHNLYKVLGGMNVKFPIQYRSEYVDPKDYEELNKKEAEEAAEREKGG